jgi:hypothetical protein
MPNAKFNLVQDNGDSQITLYYEGETHLADSSHPRWDEIFRLIVVEDNPADAVELFDVTRLLRRLVVSERVTVTFNAVLFDNDPVHDALADHIVRLVNEGEDVTAWVKLMENIKLNPHAQSVEGLFRHLSKHQYTITQQGMILAYKGVSSYGRGEVPEGEQIPEGTYYSTRSGHAIVNGVDINDYVPQRIGDVVEMPRSEVTFDPSISCSSGLHVADWGYANAMGDTVLAVLVNPRDVVSVPTDYGDAKVRVCRYKVLEVRTEPYTGAVLKTEVEVEVTPEPTPEPSTFKEGDRVYYYEGGDEFLEEFTHVGTINYVGDDQSDLGVLWDGFDTSHPYASYELRPFVDSNPDEESDSETTQENNVSATATPVRYRYPSPAKFDEIVSKAKAQKKGVRSFIESRTTWTLITGRGNGSSRKDWQV